jgi:hypothetical protein
MSRPIRALSLTPTAVLDTATGFGYERSIATTEWIEHEVAERWMVKRGE